MARIGTFLLSIGGKDLQDLDIVSHSDPFVIVTRGTRRSGPFSELGQTETIDNDLNPSFSKSFLISYTSEKDDCFFELHYYDRDSKSSDISKQAYIGSCCVSAKELINAKDMVTKIELKGSKYDLAGYAIIFLDHIPKQPVSHFCMFEFNIQPNADVTRPASPPKGNEKDKKLYAVTVSRKVLRLWKVLYRSEFCRAQDFALVKSEKIPLEWVRSDLPNPTLRFSVIRMKEYVLMVAKTYGTQDGYNSGKETTLTHFEIPMNDLKGSKEVMRQKSEKGYEVDLCNHTTTTEGNTTRYRFNLSV